jgi:hypothetical protein
MNTDTGILVHPDEAHLAKTEGVLQRATVLDCDGDSVGWLEHGYSEEQLRDIVRFANGFFSVGLRVGRNEVQTRMRAALGLSDEVQQEGT